jgi:hypothetical protein
MILPNETEEKPFSPSNIEKNSIGASPFENIKGRHEICAPRLVRMGRDIIQRSGGEIQAQVQVTSA